MTLTNKLDDEEDVKGKVQTQPRDKMQLSGWMLIWFYSTTVICTWDATFIMLRPHSLPGGSLATLWYLYKYYVTVDQRYMDTNDAFVYAQSLLNYAEVIFNIVTIIMHYHCSRHTSTIAFMVSVMTMWKTILYFLMFTELCTGGAYRAGNTAMQEFFLVVIPNIIWVIIPLYIMYVLWQKLTPEGRDIILPSLTRHNIEYQEKVYYSENSITDREHHLSDFPKTNSYTNDKTNGYTNGRTTVVKRSIQ
uniref:EXPERA domain-containing protein n=1 Tax=Arion vulgaris TaxID=1028688 RepID=A0A0B6ZC12_9EUPU